MLMIVERFLRLAARSLVWIVAVCLVLMMLNIITDVLAKYALAKSVPGTAEIVAHYYMVAAVFLPLPLVELNARSINVDVFFLMMRPSLQSICVFLAYVAQAVFFGALTWESGLAAFHAYAKGELVVGFMNVTIWPARFFLPVGFGLATVVSLLRLLQHVSRISSDGESSDPAEFVAKGVD